MAIVRSLAFDGGTTANRFDAQLVELPKATSLRPLIAEHRPAVPELDSFPVNSLGELTIKQPSHDASRPLRP